MGFFDRLFLKRKIDPALRQLLINRGEEEKLKELEKAIADPSTIGKGKESLRFEVKPGSVGEKRIKEIAKEEEQKTFGAKELRMPIGAGLKKEVEVLPGPRVTTAEALARGEDVKVTQTPSGSRISPFGIAKEVVGREIALGEKEKFLPPAEFGKGEKKRFALFALEQESLGKELSEEEEKLMDKGLKELGIEAIGSATPIKFIKGGPINAAKNKLIKDIGRKVVSQRFRGDKLNLGDDALKGIEARLGVIGAKTRTVRTFGDMEKASIELGGKPDALIRESVTSRITDAEVVGLRNLINANSQFISGAEKSILTKPELARELSPKIALAERQINESLKKLISGGTEAGRAVVAFRIMAKNNLDADFWLKRAQKELGADLTPDMQRAIRDLIDKRDINGLAEFVSMLRKPAFAEKAVTLWKAGLLTSPTTHLANIGGNVTMKALQMASDVPATSIDILTSLFTGKRTVTISPKTIAAAVRGGLKGIKNAKEFLRTGIYSDDLLSKYDIPKNVRFKNKILNGYTKGIFRSLGAEDILFRQAAMEESMEKQAWLIARNERLSGKIFKARVAELLKKPNNEMVANAVDAAEWATFQSKNPLADFISGGKGKVAGKLKQAKLRGKPTVGLQATLISAEVLAPFTKTPTNIAARLAEFTPLGFFKTMTRMIKPVNSRQKEVIESFSRALTGTGIMWLGAYLASRGKMTGNVPTDPQERADFFADGKQANSIRIGDHWFQLNRVSPFGNLLALGAEFQEIKGEEDKPADIIARTGFEGLKGLTEQTFLKGVSGGLKAVTEPERAGAKFVEQTVASTIPSLVGRIARTIDPVLRNPDGIKETILTRLPILSKGVPVRRDIFGRTIKIPGGKITTIDPFATKEAADDPVLKEAKKIGVTIGMPKQTVLGEKLTNAEYDIYQQFNGQVLKQTLDALVSDPGFQELDDTTKKELFETTITTIRTVVNETVVPELLKNRYDLPEDTNPELVAEVFRQINSNDKFKNLSDEKKNNLIQQLIK